MYSERVYKVGFWIEMSIIMKYCAIFQCNTNSSHHIGINNYLMVPHELNFVFNKTNQWFRCLKLLCRRSFHLCLSEAEFSACLPCGFTVVASLLLICFCSTQ